MANPIATDNLRYLYLVEIWSLFDVTFYVLEYPNYPGPQAQFFWIQVSQLVNHTLVHSFVHVQGHLTEKITILYGTMIHRKINTDILPQLSSCGCTGYPFWLLSQQSLHVISALWFMDLLLIMHMKFGLIKITNTTLCSNVT